MDYNEIESLVKLAKANDKNAKEELVVQFTPLILNLSKKSFVNSYEFADIKNECYHTLFKCLSLYNPEKYRFAAYQQNQLKILKYVYFERHSLKIIPSIQIFSIP